MPAISIALMGFFAFTGGVLSPFEANQESVLSASEEPPSIALAETPAFARADREDVYTVKLTSYNAVPEQTDANPHETASGIPTHTEVIAARSVDLKNALPWGTVVEISYDGEDSENCRFGAVEHLIGYRVIGDSMHSRKRAQIDILLDPTDTITIHGKEVNPSLALGVCDEVTITVIGKLEKAEVPSTQEELARIVEGNTYARR